MMQALNINATNWVRALNEELIIKLGCFKQKKNKKTLQRSKSFKHNLIVRVLSINKNPKQCRSLEMI